MILFESDTMMVDNVRRNMMSTEGELPYAGAAVRRLPEETLAV